MNRARCWLAMALVALIGTAVLGQQTPSEGAWDVELDGRKTWTVRYGVGDSLALAGASIGAGQLTLDQTMTVDFTASALSLFRVEGHFNDQEPASFQSLSLYADTENLHAVAGDFTAPDMAGFFAGSLTMKGARVDATWGDGSITGIASILSGTRDSRSFVGETAFGERLLASPESSDGDTYLSSLEGLGHFELSELFVDDFTEVRLGFDASSGLASVLDRYGVSELGAALPASSGRELKAAEFVVVGEDAQSLLLEIEPSGLVREGIRDAIRKYNETDPETSLSYPFVVGSDVESEFLGALKPSAVVSVGGEAHRLSDLGWRRFYSLGQTKVEASSISAAVSADGHGFVAVTDPSLSGYSVTSFPTQGILEVAFPESFFVDVTAKLRVSFSYAVTGRTYALGASVIPGSERVTMAGRTLTRDEEYVIDYEFGLLSLLIEIGPSDPLAVEFERYSVSGSGAYTRGFVGATTGTSLSDALSIDVYALRGADQQGSVDHPERVKIMPNVQTVVGVHGTVALPEFGGDFDIGYANDVFPYDDNARDRVANRIRAIAASADVAFVGSNAGFAARIDGTWRTYDTPDGLSGREVRAIALDESSAYFGTEGGLTVVELGGVSPLDKVANWSRYGKDDGLANVSVRALLLVGDTLWIGTDGGIFRVAVDELANPDAWSENEDPLLDEVRVLCLHEGSLYAGTTEGLARVDVTTGAATRVGGTDSEVDDLATDGTTLYVAGALGLETYVDDVSTGWITSERPVLSVEVVDGDVVYGSDEGLTRVSDGSVIHGDWSITAVTAADGSLWVGSAGDDSGELLVWRQDGTEVAYGVDATKIDPWNPRVYADPVPGDHTASGWMAEASFEHERDGFSVAGTVDRLLPGFRAIDARGRDDSGGWSVTSSIDLGPEATISVDHSYRMSDIASEDARSEADARLAFTGTFGPRVSFVVDYEAETEAERGLGRDVLSYDLTVRHQLFDEALDLSIAWGEDFSWVEELAMRRATSLSTKVSLDVLPDVETSVSWRRPVRIANGKATGSVGWSWDTQAALDVTGIRLTGNYGLDSSRGLSSTATAAFTHQAELTATTDGYKLGSWTLAPTLNLEGTYEKEALGLSGRLSVRVGSDDWAMRTVGSLDVSGLGTRVERWSEKVTSSVSYSGIEALRPSLSYTGTRSVTRVEGQGSKASVSHSVSGDLTWSSAGVTDQLEVTGYFRDSGSLNVALDNSYSRDVTGLLAAWIPALRDAAGSGVPSVSLQTDLAAEWRRDEEGDDSVTWHLGLSTDVTLSSTWSLSSGFTYYGGVKTDVDAFHGLVGELTVAIEFSAL